MICELIRLETSVKEGTFGVLRLNKKIFCYTLEPPDRENKSRVSSIPTGQYTCLPTYSPKFGDTFEVVDVTDRTHILFHAGNYEEHTEGCILLGSTITKLKKHRGIVNSGHTHNSFMAACTDGPINLTVSEVY